MLAAFDPGLTTGFALFNESDGGRLVDCGTCKPDCMTLYGFFETFEINYVVAEKPQHYRSHLSKGDPNQLTPLAIQCGIITGIAYCAGGATRPDGSGGIDQDRVHLVLPRDWKGQVPKSVTLRDCRRILTPDELVVGGGYCTKSNCKCKHHDKWDAIGLGLYGLNRLGIRSGWVRR